MANTYISGLTEQSVINADDWIEIENTKTHISRRYPLSSLLAGSLDNNTWFSGKDFDDNTVNILKITDQSTIQFGMPVEISSLYIQPDSGMVTVLDQAVTSQTLYGEDLGYHINIAAEQVVSFIADSDGTGGISNKRVYLPDNNYIDLGTGHDGKLYSDGTDSRFVLNSNKLKFYDDTTLIMTLDADSDGLIFEDVKAAIFGTGKDFYIYFDGTDTLMRALSGGIYIDSGIGDRVEIQIASAQMMTIVNNKITLAQPTSLLATDELYFDNFGHTYISEVAGDKLNIVVGGTEGMRLIEENVIGTSFHLPELLDTPTAVPTYGCIFTKNNNELYFIDGAGTLKTITTVAP